MTIIAGDKVRCHVGLRQTREDDTNGDGLYDQLDFQLSMPLTGTEQVTGVQLMLFFNYILQVTFKDIIMAKCQSQGLHL